MEMVTAIEKNEEKKDKQARPHNPLPFTLNTIGTCVLSVLYNIADWVEITIINTLQYYMHVHKLNVICTCSAHVPVCACAWLDQVISVLSGDCHQSEKTFNCGFQYFNMVYYFS